MGDDEVKKEALQIITQHNQNLPSLVVFDLDYTLWPSYCEFEEDDMPYLYSEALPILQALKEKGISMAVASRSRTPDVAKSFLQTLGISSLFVTQSTCAGDFQEPDSQKQASQNRAFSEDSCNNWGALYLNAIL
ncbi:hypothetical protein ABKV19_007743 [Rosa sericea]